MKHYFNSLGSNYSFDRAIRALFALSFDRNKLESNLESFFCNEFKKEYTYFVQNGRSALTLFLENANLPKNTTVLTQAFSCFALEQAITKAQMKPVYIDIDRKTRNPSPDTIEEAINKHKPAVLLIQHTNGYVAEIEKIQMICKQQNIILIEDLAQSYGALDENGRSVGSYADAVLLSFGRDKILDSVSGGAIVTNLKLPRPTQSSLSLFYRTYPILTTIIRSTYQVKIGKILHAILKKGNFLRSPIDEPADPDMKISSVSLELLSYAVTDHSELQRHRKAIAEIYHSYLEKYEPTTFQKNASHLRYSIVIPQIQNLLERLEKKGFHFSDRWYRTAVDGGKIFHSDFYKTGDCPIADQLSTSILNLPTHREISLADATIIAKEILKCLD